MYALCSKWLESNQKIFRLKFSGKKAGKIVSYNKLKEITLKKVLKACSKMRVWFFFLPGFKCCLGGTWQVQVATFQEN